MEKRPEEDHVEFARRCVNAGESETRISFEMNLSAGVVVALSDALAYGMSVQDLIRASVASILTASRTRSLLSGEIEDIPAAVEELSESVRVLAEAIHDDEL